MKVLLDENLPRKLSAYLTNHDCRTVTECGWAGKKNGELLTLAELHFGVLLTLDKNVPYQHAGAPHRYSDRERYIESHRRSCAADSGLPFSTGDNSARRSDSNRTSRALLAGGQ